jgi:endonuclease III
MHPAAQQIMEYYNKLEKDDDYSWLRWVRGRKRFTEDRANKLFIGIMLDQLGNADRAWEGAEYFVENYFNTKKNLWKQILDKHHSQIKSICKNGFAGKAFAVKFKVNMFPRWIRDAAKKILEEYNGDVRTVWNRVGPEKVSTIYDNFKEFKGIGDALAKMGQFMLVREYGVAGGIKNRDSMKVKPDVLLRRVVYRSGISNDESPKTVINAVDDLGLESQADFDAAAWVIGREYCFKTGPDCGECPIRKSCQKIGI